MTSSKDNNLEIFGKIFQNFHSMRTNINTSLNKFSCGEFYRQFYIIWDIGVFVAVDKGLVKIEYHSFLIYNYEINTLVKLTFLQLYCSTRQFLTGWKAGSTEHFEQLDRAY